MLQCQLCVESQVWLTTTHNLVLVHNAFLCLCADVDQIDANTKHVVQPGGEMQKVRYDATDITAIVNVRCQRCKGERLGV